MAQIRDRVIELRRIKAGDLIPDPRNWKLHPERQQEALRGILREIGIADVLLGRETPEGVVLIDGHGRSDLDAKQVWPVVILDVNESEAAELMAFADPIAAMAQKEDAALDAILAEVNTEEEALQQLAGELASEEEQEQVDRSLEEIDAGTLPERPIWVLCTVPVDKMPDVAPVLAQLADLGVTVETSDGEARHG